MHTCTNCGHYVPEATAACPNCRMKGAFRPSVQPKNALTNPFQTVENCQNCGNELPPTAEMCGHCKMPRMAKCQPPAGKNGLFKIASFLN